MGEESSVNPRHVSINPVPRLHAGPPPVFEAWQAAFDVGEDAPACAVDAGAGPSLILRSQIPGLVDMMV